MNEMTTSKRVMRASMAAAVLFAAAGSAGAAAVSSDFAVDTDGWQLFGDAISAIPAFVAAGGNPGGYAHGTDQTAGNTWYWQAPEKFLGDRSSSFQQLLSFDMRMRGSGPLFEVPDVTLIGGGLTLQVDLSPVPENIAWTSYSVRLDETGGWKLGTLAGPNATNTQI
jgi:alkaline phosphatase D